MWEGSKWPSDSHLLLGSCGYKIGCVSTVHDAEYSMAARVGSTGPGSKYMDPGRETLERMLENPSAEWTKNSLLNLYISIYIPVKHGLGTASLIKGLLLSASR